jgi:5-methyltetrahydropteroyltriglutamate--homocysteine methyltransferase
MKRSRDRILTTHAGSLPRPDDLLEMTRGDAAHAARVRAAVADVVRAQAEHGIDVVDDGEMSKPSFVTYVTERLAGFEPVPEAGGLPWAGSKEVRAFPEFYAATVGASPNAAASRWACTGPVRYVGQALVAADAANLRAALAGARVEEAFLPAISPSNVEGRYPNRFYRTDQEYLLAIAEAMAHEYRAIVDAGFLLQIDDPRLVTYYIMDPASTVAEARAWAEVRVEALNHALRGIPRDRVRFHTCYSINMGPRVHDMELRDIVDVLLRVNAGAYSFEAANPRHEHEWQVWRGVTLPEDAVLIPGVITQSTVLVEHPDLVAQRIERFASVVGRERVIAGADCGFATFAGSKEIHPQVAWAKLAALVEGARRASRHLWA